MLGPTAACNFWTSDLQKVVRTCGVLHILTYKCASRHRGVTFCRIGTSKSFPPPGILDILTCQCASRHSGVPFLNIGTSKIGPAMRSFGQFDLKMCFAPQRRAIFHLSAEQLPPHPRFSEATFRTSGTTNH